jgi:DUF4097 and DUF4098 domain-containing protein YvlB
MKRKLRTPAAVLLALAVVSCGDAFGPDTVDTEWSGVVALGETIEIKGINGDIIATSASGNSVIVTASKEGDNSDPSEVQIEVITHSGGVTICAVYPDVPGELPNECAPRAGGRMNTRDNDVEVTFWVSVPTGVDFVGSTVNGSVIGTDLESEAIAYTVNGDILISSSQLVTAGTVNGSIDARIGVTDLHYDLGYTAVNGDITVHVPATLNADVYLHTINGSITADMSFTVVSPGDIRGVLGNGGNTLAMSTVNGNLELDSGS